MDPRGGVLATTARIARPEDSVTAYGWKALAGSAIGYSMDGFDLLIVSFMLTAISTDLGLTGTESGSLITWTLTGAVVGGLIFGGMSDHFGRIRVLTWTILVFAGFTGLCGFARGYWDMAVYRTFAGLGLGGEFGIGMALAAEAWPASRRARVSSYVGLGWNIGVLLAALVTPQLLPIVGWRGMFFLGLLPALVASVVRRTLDEPEIFVRKHACRKESSIRFLFKDAPTRTTTLGIAILCCVQIFGYYGIMIWMPSYLAKSHGFSLTKSGMWTSMTILGMVVGILTFGELADRIGRKPVLILFQIGALLMVFLYSRVTAPNLILGVGAIMGIFVNGWMCGLGTLMSEAYPTAARATAQNALWNFGRAVGGLGPLTVGTLAAKYSYSVAIGLLASIYVIAIVATVLLVPELKGKELK